MSTNGNVQQEEKPFSPLLFIFTVCAWFAIYCAITYKYFPASFRCDSIWWWGVVVIIFVFHHGLNSVLEVLFHRYVLHQPFLIGLKRLFRQHDTIHHNKHTLIRKIPIPGDTQRVKVSNDYPIVRPEQHEASYFPWFTTGGFLAFVSLWLVPLQIVFPSSPLMLGGAFSIVFSLILYEFIHAALHYPLEWWDPKLFHSPYRRFWRWIYADHLRHHANDKCCLGISKFFGVIPLADKLFGTWVNEGELYRHGSEIEITHFEAPRPIALIRWLDVVVENRIKRRRKRRILTSLT